MRLIIKALIVAVVSVPPVLADEDQEILFNRVYLDATAEREVPNDEMVVILRAEHQGREPAEVAARVNEDMSWALEQAKAEKAVERQSGSYGTWPIYDNRVITGWRASQDLELRSTSIDVLTKLVGRLQSRLQVGSMTFQPTREMSERVREELIEEALKVFKRRAEIIGRHMPGRDYRIVELHVGTGGQPPRPMLYERAMAMAADAKMAPAVEAGTSLLQVTVSGNVQFY